MKKLYAVFFVTTILFFSACTKHDENNNVNDIDYSFMMQVARTYKSEIQEGQLAMSKSNEPSVKVYGQTVINGYTAARDELQQIADQLHVQLEDSTDIQRQSLMDGLTALSGHSFDTTYMMGQVKTHQKLMSLFQSAFNQGNNASVKGYVHRHIDIITSYYLKADSLARNL